MNRFATIALTLILVSTLIAGPEGYWPAWRGPNATGAAVKGDPPTTWSESQNIKWKVAVPGAGSSSPVIWADRIIFLTGRDGTCAVLNAADAYEPIALNKLDDAFDASPAIIDNEIYLKGKNLYCIAAP